MERKKKKKVCICMCVYIYIYGDLRETVRGTYVRIHLPFEGDVGICRFPAPFVLVPCPEVG